MRMSKHGIVITIIEENFSSFCTLLIALTLLPVGKMLNGL